MDGTITLARPAAADDRAHDVATLRREVQWAIGHARGHLSHAALMNARGEGRAARAALWCAERHRVLAARYARAAALRAGGLGLFAALRAAGIHSAGG